MKGRNSEPYPRSQRHVLCRGLDGRKLAAAPPFAFVADWTINFTVAKVDVTALGDSNLVWVAGLPDASGDFTGFYDTATSQTYTAIAVDGLPRNFYLYSVAARRSGRTPASTSSGRSSRTSAPRVAWLRL